MIIIIVTNQTVGTIPHRNDTHNARELNRSDSFANTYVRLGHLSHKFTTLWTLNEAFIY